MQVVPPSNSRFDRLPSWQRAAVLAITISVTCLLLFLVAEAAVRIRAELKYGGSFWGIDETYELDPATGLRIPIPGGRFGPISINSFGFRSPEITKETPPHRLRLAFLGGSTTYCAEVSSNEMTWPHLVWKALHERWPSLDLDYINAGVPGNTTGSVLRTLKIRVAQFMPDVIILEAGNDLSQDTRKLAMERGGYIPTQEHRPGWVARHSLLAFLIEKNLTIWRLQRRPETQAMTFTPDWPKLTRRFRTDLALLVEQSQKIASVVAIVTNAPRLRRSQNTEERRRRPNLTVLYALYVDRWSASGI